MPHSMAATLYGQFWAQQSNPPYCFALSALQWTLNSVHTSELYCGVTNVMPLNVYIGGNNLISLYTIMYSETEKLFSISLSFSLSFPSFLLSLSF